MAKKVQDSELAAWLAHDSGETRELIIDAALPVRKIAFSRQGNGRLRPSNIRSDGSARHRLLHELEADLAEVLDTPPKVLETAGALAIKATGSQVRELAEHPLVKAIRPNRRLRAG